MGKILTYSPENSESIELGLMFSTSFLEVQLPFYLVSKTKTLITP